MDVNLVVSPNTKCTSIRALFQWDYGVRMKITGLGNTVPTAHFAFEGQNGAATLISCSSEGESIIVPIPNVMLMQDKNVFCYLYFETADSGMTTLAITIPILPRPKPGDVNYTEEEHAQFDALMAELNAAIERVDGMQQSISEASNVSQKVIDAADEADYLLNIQFEVNQADGNLYITMPDRE